MATRKRLVIDRNSWLEFHHTAQHDTYIAIYSHSRSGCEKRKKKYENDSIEYRTGLDGYGRNDHDNRFM